MSGFETRRVLRALIVGRADDAQRIVASLERAGFQVESERVSSPAALREALEGSAWDVAVTPPARERLSVEMEVLARLGGSIAHELNNALSVIVGHAELLSDEPERPDSVRESAQAIRGAARRASELTRNLRAASGREALQPAAVDLARVLARVAESVGPARSQAPELVVRCPAGLPRAWCDPAHLERAIVQLVANAREASRATGVVALEARAEDDGARVVVEVRDEGTGMTEETSARAFEPFYSTKGSGRGLGLPTVLDFASRSGGALDLQSRAGRGTTVALSLPGAPATATPPRDALAGASNESLRGSETVVLVEDEEAVRRLVQVVLARHGYQVRAFPNGESAAAFFEGQGEKIDLLLTDVIMPGMSGRELAARVLERRPGLTVLYMSGYTGGAISAAQAGEPEIVLLRKPFTPTELARTVRQILDTRRSD